MRPAQVMTLQQHARNVADQVFRMNRYYDLTERTGYFVTQAELDEAIAQLGWGRATLDVRI